MSQESMDVVRAYYERWDAKDLRPAFRLLARDVEWHTAPTSLSAGKTLHGVGAVVEHMDELLDAEVVEEAEASVERIVDLGEEVLVLERETYVGRVSGVRTEARTGAIYKVAEGRIVQARGFMSHEEALEAAGLSG
jgi:ketosteroid isomerase-like protein